MKLSSRKMNIIMAEQGVNTPMLAVKSNVSRNTISAVLNGKTCRRDTAGKIAKALGVSVAELVEK